MAQASVFCPKCNISLSPLTYHGITVDKCSNCGGVWIDKGEESFVAEVIRRADKESCGNCIYLIDRRKCKLLKIVVNSDFHCSHFARS